MNPARSPPHPAEQQSRPAARWRRFLKEILPDRSVREFVGRAIGYTLTGLTREQCFFLLSGTGSNGKTTLLHTLADVFGPLALNLPFSTFTVKYGHAVATNDLAAMPGKRLVSASESGETSTIDESRLKALSGEDVISARFLFHEYFEFRPVAKLWLACNHKPVVRDDTFAFWRRVRCVDFPVRFEGDAVDKNLNDTLAAELPGILAWCVRKAGAYLRDGLPVPDAVQVVTENYRQESDPLGDFYSERCLIAENQSATFSDLYAAYQLWCEDRNIRGRDMMTRNAIGRKMGVRFERRGGCKGAPRKYVGIGLNERNKT